MQAGAHVGPFVLLEWLGADAFGDVWLANRADADTLRWLHVRQRQADDLDWTSLCQQFDRGLEEARRLSHPAIRHVDYHGIHPATGALYWVESRSPIAHLDALVDVQGALPPAHCCVLLEPVVDALIRAEQLGLSHGRVRPSAVSIDAEGGVWLGEFGLWRVLGCLDSSAAVPGAPDAFADARAVARLARVLLTERGEGSATPPAAWPPALRALVELADAEERIDNPLMAVCDWIRQSLASLDIGDARAERLSLASNWDFFFVLRRTFEGKGVGPTEVNLVSAAPTVTSVRGQPEALVGTGPAADGAVEGPERTTVGPAPGPLRVQPGRSASPQSPQSAAPKTGAPVISPGDRTHMVSPSDSAQRSAQPSGQPSGQPSSLPPRTPWSDASPSPDLRPGERRLGLGRAWWWMAAAVATAGVAFYAAKLLHGDPAGLDVLTTADVPPPSTASATGVPPVTAKDSGTASHATSVAAVGPDAGPSAQSVPASDARVAASAGDDSLDAPADALADATDPSDSESGPDAIGLDPGRARVAMRAGDRALALAALAQAQQRGEGDEPEWVKLRMALARQAGTIDAERDRLWEQEGTDEKLALAPALALAALLVDDGRGEAAIQVLFRRAGTADERADFHYGIGWAHESQRQWDPAAEAYLRALELDSGYEAAVWGLIRVRHRRSNLRAALRELESRLERTPQEALMPLYAGEIDLRARKLKGAERELADFCRTHPRQWRGWFALGVAQYHLHRLGESIESYARALPIAPVPAVVQHNLALAHARIGNSERASELWNSMIQADENGPHAWRAHCELARLRMRADDRVEAKRHVIALATLRPSHEWAASAARGDFDSARVRDFLGRDCAIPEHFDSAAQLDLEGVPRDGYDGRL